MCRSASEKESSICVHVMDDPPVLWGKGGAGAVNTTMRSPARHISIMTHVSYTLC